MYGIGNYSFFGFRYIRKLNEDTNPAVSEVASKICDLESRLKDSDKQISAAGCQIDQLTKANESYKRDICEKEKQITDSNSILCELREKLLKQEDLQKSVEKELTQLKAKNETLMNLNEKQKIELNNFKRQELGESSKVGIKGNILCSSKVSFIQKILLFIYLP